MSVRWLGMVLALTLAVAACGDSGGFGDLSGDPGDLGDLGSGDLGDLRDLGGGGDLGGLGDLGDLGAGGDLGDLGDLGNLGGLGAIPGLSDECAAVFGVMTGITQVMFGAGGELGSLFDTASTRAPRELRREVATIESAFAQFAEELRSAGIDLSDQTALLEMGEEELAAYTSAGEVFESQAFTDAMDKLGEYVDQNCNLGE